MATTVTASTLTVTIQETLTLNGTAYNQNMQKNITGIGNYHKAIYTVRGSGLSHNIAEFVALPSGDKFSVEDLRYVRVTNLDDTNNVTASFSSSGASAGIECTPGSSALLFDKRIGASGLSGPISKVGALDTLFLFNPNASGVDVEVVIASK